MSVLLPSNQSRRQVLRSMMGGGVAISGLFPEHQRHGPGQWCADAGAVRYMVLGHGTHA